MALTTLALLARDTLHVGPSTIGVLGAVAGLTMVAATAGISARLRPEQLEHSVEAGTFLLVLSLVIFALGPSVLVLGFATVLLGISGGLAFPGLTGTVQRAARQTGINVERSTAIFSLVLSASLAIAPLIESEILSLSHQDTRVPFAAFAALPAIAGFLVSHRRRTAIEVSAPPHSATRFRLLQDPSARLAFAGQLMYQVPFVGLSVFGASIARTVDHASAASAELAFTSFFAASFVTRVVVAMRSPLVGKRGLLIGSGFATLAGLVAIAMTHSLAGFMIGMAVLGIPHGVILPVALGLLGESLPPDALPRANSVLIGSSNAMGILVPPVLGRIASGSSYSVMVFAIVVPVVALFALVVATARKHSLSY